MPHTTFSIILPVKNEGLNIKATVDSILRTEPVWPYEILVVDDSSSDGCCSFLKENNYSLPNLHIVSTKGLGAAGARNAGANAARGEILIFCDAHVMVPPDWLARLHQGITISGAAGISPGIASMADPNAVGYGQAWNDRLEARWLPRPSGITEAPLLPGGCQAFLRQPFERVGGYDRGFKVWGREDEEISLKMWLFGYPLFVEPGLKVLHLFRQSHPYPVTLSNVDYNFIRMACSHFSEKRLAAAFSLKSGNPGFEQLLASVFLDGVWDQRRAYLAGRKNDDEWYLQRFNIPF